MLPVRVTPDPATITCYECNYFDSCTAELCNTATDCNGYYYKRYNLSYVYTAIKLSDSTPSHDIIIQVKKPDHDSDRQSHFDPVFIMIFYIKTSDDQNFPIRQCHHVYKHILYNPASQEHGNTIIMD